ncbi:hypothetical protein PZH42_30085, partial [Bacteroides cellulosilyticus]
MSSAKNLKGVTINRLRKILDDPIIRKREMKWLQEQGVKGIKVDFFGGDKQETNRLKTYGDRELTQPANGSHLGGNTRCRMIGVLHQFV